MYGLGGAELGAGNFGHLLAELDVEALQRSVRCVHPLHLAHRRRPAIVWPHAMIQLKHEIIVFVSVTAVIVRLYRHTKRSLSRLRR